MSDLKESQSVTSSKLEELEVFQDDDEFEEFEEGTRVARQFHELFLLSFRA